MGGVGDMTRRGARRQFALATPDAGHQAATGKVDRLERVQTGAFQPALHLVVGEAEMDMGMLALQLDQVVRREVDDQHDAAGANHAPVTTLSPQERRVLQLFAKGHNSATVARRLGISGQTVRNHLHRINRKLRTHSRLEAVTHALNRGLLD